MSHNNEANRFAQRPQPPFKLYKDILTKKCEKKVENQKKRYGLAERNFENFDGQYRQSRQRGRYSGNNDYHKPTYDENNNYQGSSNYSDQQQYPEPPYDVGSEVSEEKQPPPPPPPRHPQQMNPPIQKRVQATAYSNQRINEQPLHVSMNQLQVRDQRPPPPAVNTYEQRHHQPVMNIGFKVQPSHQISESPQYILKPVVDPISRPPQQTIIPPQIQQSHHHPMSQQISHQSHPHHQQITPPTMYTSYQHRMQPQRPAVNIQQFTRNNNPNHSYVVSNYSPTGQFPPQQQQQQHQGFNQVNQHQFQPQSDTPYYQVNSPDFIQDPPPSEFNIEQPQPVYEETYGANGISQLPHERHGAAQRNAENAQIVCRFFINGWCKNGEYCQFKHERKALPEDSKRQYPKMKMDKVCMFYVNGKCKNGENCAYKHEDSSTIKHDPDFWKCWSFNKPTGCAKRDCQWKHELFTNKKPEVKKCETVPPPPESAI